MIPVERITIALADKNKLVAYPFLSSYHSFNASMTVGLPYPCIVEVAGKISVAT